MSLDDIAEVEAEKGRSTSSLATCEDYATVAAITQAAVILALLAGMGVIIYKYVIQDYHNYLYPNQFQYFIGQAQNG